MIKLPRVFCQAAVHFKLPRIAACHQRYAHSSNENIERTCLYDLHIKYGGKIVNFGGFALPVQYADQSITASHLHTRQHASIFDVSHMLQTYVRGKDAIACMESVCTADIKGLPAGSGSLTVFTTDKGGILDDLIVTKVKEDELYVVSNAAMKKQDMDIMSAAVAHYKQNGKDVAIEFLAPSDKSLVAVQGPKAVAFLSKLLPKGVDMSGLYFMNTMVCEVAGVPNCRITRCGYTGEDGVEISVDSAQVRKLTEALLFADPNMKLAGLGARDSLRLEAGLCLYGSDIDQSTTPVEAGLNWLIAKRRRAELNFPGAQTICEQLKTGVSRQRVGFQMLGSAVPPARAHVSFHASESASATIGEVTSGGPSPSLNKNIGMGYVASEYKKPGTIVKAKIRQKHYDAEIVKMPFLKAHYYMKPKV